MGILHTTTLHKTKNTLYNLIFYKYVIGDYHNKNKYQEEI